MTRYLMLYLGPIVVLDMVRPVESSALLKLIVKFYTTLV